MSGDSGSLTRHTANAIHDIVHHLLSNSVVTTGVVVGGILLAADQHLGMEQLAVFAGADLINGRRVEINEERARHMLAAAGLAEEGLVGALLPKVLGIRIRTTIGAEAMLEEVAGSSSQREVRASLRLGMEKRAERTAPRQSYQAGYQLGRDEGG